MGISDSEEFAAWFWSNVDRREPDVCWPWLGATNGVASGGRGRIDKRVGATRIRAYASAIVWKFTHSQIPDGLCVLHRCDNPNCVNPAHLFLGTQADNQHDMHVKGRADPFGHKKEVRSGVRINRRRGERISQGAPS